MGKHKLKLDEELYSNLTKAAEAAGYADTDEFILHTLDKAAAAVLEADSEEIVRQRLQGLGYIE